MSVTQLKTPQREFIRRLVRDQQPKFRKNILDAYAEICALTPCEVKECLEAVHIDRFSNSYNDDVTNGILLRADLHRLMDACLITFEWWSSERITVKIDSSVKDETYRDLEGKAIRLPDVKSHRPSKEWIERHAKCRTGRN